MTVKVNLNRKNRVVTAFILFLNYTTFGCNYMKSKLETSR